MRCELKRFTENQRHTHPRQILYIFLWIKVRVQFDFSRGIFRFDSRILILSQNSLFLLPLAISHAYLILLRNEFVSSPPPPPAPPIRVWLCNCIWLVSFFSLPSFSPTFLGLLFRRIILVDFYSIGIVVNRILMNPIKPMDFFLAVKRILCILCGGLNNNFDIRGPRIWLIRTIGRSYRMRICDGQMSVYTLFIHYHK